MTVIEEHAAMRDRPDLGGPDVAAAFTQLFDAHAGALRGYLARRIGGAAADDLVADTFLVAIRQRHRYDPSRAAARSWLYGIATGLLRNHLRQELRELRAVARAGARVEHQPGPEPVVADRVDAQVRVGQLAQALARLEPGDRDVLLLTAWAGLDSAEVAAALDIPVGTVRSRLHRVRRWLRANAPQQRIEDNDE
jgi:RNA polymerase sigma-70 factor (ECF subfamily)